jgi:hypothetical protein
MRSALALLLALLASPHTFAASAASERVTLLQLLADPDKFDGKQVAVIGYLHLQFEGDTLWLHKEDFDHAIIGNMLSVVVTKDIEKKRDELNDRYVLVVATFDAKDKGHMGLCSGTLKDVKNCAVWNPAGQPAERSTEPGGAANRSQPVRSETNQPPAAAGSGP